MARNSTDTGTQVITYDYAQSATTEDINKQVYKLIRPGIYDGLSLSIEQADPAQVRVSTGVCYIEAANDVDLGVRVETTTEIVLSDIAPATPYVIIHFEWYNDPDSFAEIKSVAIGSIEDEDLILGIGTFSGSTLTGFTLDDGVHPRDYVSNNADTLLLGDSASVTSSPTGGTATNLSGATADVVEALQEAFNRLIDLSGVNNDGVKNRHVDFGTGATQINGGDIPIATAVTTGGTASNITDTTVITTALQSLATALQNMSGADNDSIKERHIDWGVSTNQIDADLLPLGTAINQVLSEASDIAFTSSKTVRSALTDLATALSSISTQVTTNKNSIGVNSGDQTSFLSLYNNNSNIPVGFIGMYDGGTGTWVDNVTMPGWYACISSNAAHGCPDLVDKFVKGAANGTKGSTYGVTGGEEDCEVTITESNLPTHTHSINHGHTTASGANITGSTNPSHNHNIAHQHEYMKWSGKVNVDKGGAFGDTNVANDANQTLLTTEGPTNSSTTSIAHTHSVTVDNHSGSSGNGGFDNDSISIDPEHYKVIFIRKCYQRS